MQKGSLRKSSTYRRTCANTGDSAFYLRPANPNGEGSKSAKRGKCAKAVS